MFLTAVKWQNIVVIAVGMVVNKRFHVMVAIRAEITLHSIDHIGHSHKEDGLQTVNQSVGNASSGIGSVSYTHLDVYKRQT